MQLRLRRGTILVTAMFVVLVVHALVTVMLTTLRADTGQLQTSEQRMRAAFKAHSAAQYAFDQLQGPQAITWEDQHTVATRPDSLQPPSEAADVRTTLADGSTLEAKAWVEETSDPTIRTVWGASRDKNRWHFSTAIAVRREVNPGLLFGVKLGLLADDFYFRPSNGDGTWQHAPTHPSVGNRVYDCSASRDGRLFILLEDQNSTAAGRDLKVGVLDTTSGTNGTWSSLPDLPNNFIADPTGLAVGVDELYVAGMEDTTNTAAILKMPLSGASPSWSPLAALPDSVQIDSAGNRIVNSLPFQFTDLKSGLEGELYVQLQFRRATPTQDAITTFARFKDGDWSYFPKPSSLSGVTRRGLLPLEIDDLGNALTFGLPTDQEPGQIFRFAPTGDVTNSVIRGQWKPLPTQTQNAQIRALTIDTEGHMYLGTEEQSNLRLTFQELTEHPLRADQQATPQDVTLPENSMHFLEAGGEGPTGGIEYVPVSWY